MCKRNESKEKVIIGMSGGVDSAVTAYLLQEAGYEVIGVTLRTWESGTNRCCEIGKAKQTARQLGIRYYPWNVLPLFREHVVYPFLEEYLHGRTPNPCVECNRYVKWEGLLHIADVLKADCVATGHYASVIRCNGRFSIRRGEDKNKDQSYMLYKLTQEQLSRTILPLGGLSKQEVREIAAQKGISPINQAESQEICFVTEGGYAEYIASETANGVFAPGNFVDEAGKILGRHKGIVHYTVGQRKGLGLALGYPVYVKEIRADSNEIVVGEAASLYITEIFCDSLAFMGIPPMEQGSKISALISIRYHHSGEWGTIEKIGEDMVRIVFESPVKAPAPGQSAVFYDEQDCIIGGGRIMKN